MSARFYSRSRRLSNSAQLTRRGPRPLPLFLSALFHGAVIAWAFTRTSPFTPPPDPEQLASEIVAPETEKIVWYHLRDLPVLDPVQEIGDSQEPQGHQKRNDVIISVLPNGKAADQVILRPDVKAPLDREVPSPNLVSVAASNETKSPVKKFTPPPPVPSLPVRRQDIPPPPVIATAPALATPNPLREPLGSMPKLTKQFVVPVAPPKAVEARVKIDELAPPQVDGASKAPNQGLEDILQKTHQPRKPFVPPSSQKQSGSGVKSVAITEPDAALAGTINAAILSTHPTLVSVAALPQGIRPAEMSQAPAIGEPAFRGGPNASPVPGLVVLPQNQTAAPMSAPSRIEYEETRIAAVRSTLSAPLRPSSRTIPQTIESRFHGRVVYSMIIPMPRLPIYAGDWIMWFAERDPKPGETPQMRAPLPVRKLAPASDQSAQPGGRAQLSATILKTGRVDSAESYGKAGLPVNSAAIADLQSWQFLPALRNGEAVDVEIIIEIPFR